MEAWNHHPLRTEHGLSPSQLWHRGMLSASPRWQQEIADGFCVPPDYGIEESEYFVYNFHHPSVVMPRTDINLTTHQKRQLEGLYSPFQYSDHGGVDIQWNLSKRTLRERDTVLNTSPQRTKPNPQIYPSLSI